MPDWYCRRSGSQHGPLSARQLRELAVTGKLRPDDEVSGNGTWVAAEQVRGLLYDVTACPQEATVNIIWPGISLLGNVGASVRFDDELLGTGSLVRGFAFTVQTKPGRHIVAVKFPLRREKQYVINLDQPNVYSVTLTYSTFWGNFTNQCRLFLDPKAAQLDAQVEATAHLWAQEARAAQCQSCRAEWAVAHLGNKVIHREQIPRTRIVTEETVIENPNYDRLHPFSNAVRNIPPVLRGETQRMVQVIAVIDTIREYYKCEQCGKKWERDRTHEYVP